NVFQAALLDCAGFDPAVGEGNEAGPVAFELELDFEADGAVVEVAQAGVGGFAGSQVDGRAGFEDRRALEAYVLGGGALEPGRTGWRGDAQKLAEFAEVELLGEIVEEQGAERAAAEGHGSSLAELARRERACARIRLL